MAYEVTKEKPNNENTNIVTMKLEKLQMTVNGQSKESWEFIDIPDTEIANNDLLLQNVTSPFEQSSVLTGSRRETSGMVSNTLLIRLKN